ncbi:MAG: hypothetical protein WDN01_07165 [Rhizomicrobium sp.]
MTSSTRIEIFDRRSVVSMPFQIHPAFIPHAVLIVFIAGAWAADGVYEIARLIVG